MKTLQVIYGANWGSEGKGSIAAYLAKRELSAGNMMIAIRVGGPNAGHTFKTSKGETQVTQTVPVAAFCSTQPGNNVVPVIGPAAVIDPTNLAKELRDLLDHGWTGNIIIDVSATVIQESHRQREAELKGAIGSTGKGVGAATADKVMRSAMPFYKWLEWQRIAEEPAVGIDPEDVKLILDIAVFANTPQFLIKLLEEENHCTVQIEGTQGYGLSLNTSGYYPYATSRDCGPDDLMGQCGISSRSGVFDKTEIWAVMRTYPIRVAGNSGPMGEELSWEDMGRITNGYAKPEITTVTKKTRRVAALDWDMMREQFRRIQPTNLAVTFMDYVDPALNYHYAQISTHLGDWAFDPDRDQQMAKYLNGNQFYNLCLQKLQVPVSLVGVGPDMIVDLRNTVPDPSKFGHYLAMARADVFEYLRGRVDGDIGGVSLGIKQQLANVAQDIMDRLGEAGVEYGEDVIYATGEAGIINLLVHKALRNLWGYDNDLPFEYRVDHYRDMAAYAMIAMAMHLQTEGMTI